MATSRFLHPTRTPAAPLEENTSPCLPSKLAQAFAVVLALLYYLFFLILLFLCEEKAGAISSRALQSAALFQQCCGSLQVIRASLEEKIEQLGSRRCLPHPARLFILLVSFQMNKFARQQ